MKVSFILLLVLIPSMARAAIEKQELSKGVQASAHQRQLHHTNVDRISSPVETSEDAQMFSEKSIAAREAGEVKLHLHRRRRAGREGVRPRTETSDDTPNLSRPGKSGSVLEKEDHHPQDQRSSEGSSDANRRERGDRNLGANVTKRSENTAGQGSQLPRLDTSRCEDHPLVQATNKNTEPQQAAGVEDATLLSQDPCGIPMDQKPSADKLNQGPAAMVLRNEHPVEVGGENFGGSNAKLMAPAKSGNASLFSASSNKESSKVVSHEVKSEDANKIQPATTHGNAAEMPSKDSDGESRTREEREETMMDDEHFGTPEGPQEHADRMGQQLKQEQGSHNLNHNEIESRNAFASNHREKGFEIGNGSNVQQYRESRLSQGDRQQSSDKHPGQAEESEEVQAFANVAQQQRDGHRNDMSVDDTPKDHNKEDEAANKLEDPPKQKQKGFKMHVSTGGKHDTAVLNNKESQDHAATMQAGHEPENDPAENAPEQVVVDSAQQVQPANHVEPQMKPFLSLLDTYHIASFLDVPCGDVEQVANKLRFFPSDRLRRIRYIGVDAMDRNIDLAVQMQGTVPAWNFYNINFLRDDLPTADLLISRAALLRLPLLQLVDLLENCANSGAKLLLLGSFLYFDVVTSIRYDSWSIKNYPAQDKGVAYSVNLQQAPFNLDEPLQKITEPEGFGARNKDGKQIHSDKDEADADSSTASRELLLFSGEALRKKDFAAMRSRVTAFVAIA